MERFLRLSVASVILALTFTAAGWAYGQAPQLPTPREPSPAPRIISGNDIGFRVDRLETERLGKLTGTWVVRVNGQWIEPEPLRTSRPLSTR